MYLIKLITMFFPKYFPLEMQLGSCALAKQLLEIDHEINWHAKILLVFFFR